MAVEGFALDKRRMTVFDALIAASREFGPSKKILIDQDRKPISYLDAMRAAFALGSKIRSFTQRREPVGVLLPSSVGVAVTFFALQAIGRTPAMLNFTSGAINLTAACRGAGIKTILTARKFVDQGKLGDLIEALAGQCRIVYLEDVRASVGIFDKLYAAIAATFPRVFAAPTKPSDPGVVLFTSGSFGAPKGVLLTQSNLVANCRQVAQQIPLDPSWTFVCPLPTFHCFGLTGGVLLPLLTGMRAALYPSPLHHKQIPEFVRDVNGTILVGTDTFVQHYARAAKPGDFASLKFIACGAERVREETHQLFAERFGVEIIEGYGATEAAPIIAVNRPGFNCPGTVGPLLPGIEARLEPVPGLDNAGKLIVRGPNVMAGYLKGDGTLAHEPTPGGWHDTGDVVRIGENGCVAILGRVKRFAKIGGEMVSLTAIENYASEIWPGVRHAVVSVPCHRKGERLVLVTECQEAETGSFLNWAQRNGAPELAIPRKVVKVGEVPVLGTGKTDYGAVQKLASDLVEVEAA